MMTKFSRMQGTRSPQLFVAIAAVGVLACGSNALAGMLIGVAQNPTPPSGPFVGNNDQNDAIMVGSGLQPIVLQPAIDGAVWEKEFVINRDGQGWSTSRPESMVSVTETLTFLSLDPSIPLGYPRVVDWHEDIVTTAGDGANFKWVGGQVVFLTSPLPPFPATVSADGKSIWFDFPGIPFVPMSFTKQLIWTGGPVTPGPNGTNDYHIMIIEQPSISIPEPSSLTLSCLVIACAVSRAGRRQSMLCALIVN
jgi:hypothetical protein